MKRRQVERKFVRAISSCAMAIVCVTAAGCANLGGGIGLSIPVGPFGSIGVNLGSDGRIGGSVGVGYGGASVSVGTSRKLPAAKAPDNVQK
jgi:hypothetical protein